MVGSNSKTPQLLALKGRDRRALPSLALLAVLFPQPAYSQIVIPLKPLNPSLADCVNFRGTLYEASQEIYRRNQECMRRGFSTSGYSGYPKRNECVPGTPARLRLVATAYPDCHDEEETQCAIQNSLYVDVPQCFASANATKEERKLAQRTASASEKIAEYHALEKKAFELRSGIKNPIKFFLENVTSRLPRGMMDQLHIIRDDIKAKIPSNVVFHPLDLFQLDGKGTLAALYLTQPEAFVTPQGFSLSMETYNFLFSKSAGNSSLYSSNPVIAAIQGQSANHLRKIQSMMFGQLDVGVNQMSLITQNIKSDYVDRSTYQGTTPNSSVKPASRGATECSVLDSDERTDLSINQPEEFERLLKKCRIKQ